jgi:hypothetical protein
MLLSLLGEWAINRPNRLVGSGMLLSLLGHSITEIKGKYQFASLAYAVDSTSMGDIAYKQPEFITYHYTSPRKMLAADQRVMHEKVDRMVNAVASGQVNSMNDQPCRRALVLTHLLASSSRFRW